MPKLKNSNATFWEIFKHCVHLLFRVTLLLQPSWLYCWPKQVFFFDLGKQKKKQLCVNAESEIENNSAWEKVIGSVVVRHLNFGWTTQRVCVIYISGHRRVFRKKNVGTFCATRDSLTRNFVQFIFVKIGLLLGQFFEAPEVMKKERR